MSGRAFFIINPVAGRGTVHRWRRLEGALRRLRVDYDQALTTGPGHALDLARQAIGQYDPVVAVGGDGTLFEVINGMLAGGSNHTQLAMVPFGSGNDSARSAGIHSEADALQALRAGQRHSIDLIEIHCQAGGAPLVRQAMLFASVGITSHLLKHTTPRLKRLCGGRLAYLAGLLSALRSYAPRLMNIACDGQTVRGRFIFAGASNAETFGGGIRIAPGARVDDGKMNVNLIEAVGRWEVLRHLLKLLQGRHLSHPKVAYRTALSLVIETDPPVEVAADGELIGETPARFQVRPQALTILAS